MQTPNIHIIYKGIPTIVEPFIKDFLEMSDKEYRYKFFDIGKKICKELNEVYKIFIYFI